VQIVNRAHPITHCGTWKLEGWWLCGGDDLYAKASKWRAKIALITHSEMCDNGSVATKTATDADRLLISQLSQLVHRGVA
jgi:hypothetical protein